MNPLDEPTRGVSRRTLTKATAWSVPAILVAGPAPAFAASPPVPVPGAAFVSACLWEREGFLEVVYRVAVNNPTGFDITVLTIAGSTDFASLHAVNGVSVESGVPATIIPAGTSANFNLMVGIKNSVLAGDPLEVPPILPLTPPYTVIAEFTWQPTSGGASDTIIVPMTLDAFPTNPCPPPAPPPP